MGISMTSPKKVMITPEALEKLRQKALIESVGASTRLAGSKLSDEQVKELLEEMRRPVGPGDCK
jgi:hypothetical protein